MKTSIKIYIGVIAILAATLSATTSQAQDFQTEDRLAVTPQGFDDMGEVLNRLGFSATEITVDTLRNADDVKGYQALYINCSDDWQPMIYDESGNNPELDPEKQERITQAADAIREYVNNGGIVYASDFAATLIDTAFPGKIDFYGPTMNDAFAGYPGIQTATIADPGLADVIGKQTVEINYDLPSWIVIEGVAPEVRVYISGAAPIVNVEAPPQFVPDPETGDDKEVFDLLETLENKPYVVAFSEGEGAVLYTTFHNEVQTTADTEKILDWFAVWAKGGKLHRQMEEITPETATVIKEIIDDVSVQEIKTYTFDISAESDVHIAVNSEGGQLGLTVKDQNDEAVVTNESDQFPIQAAIAKAEGTYTVEVKGVEVLEENMPFVLTIATEEVRLDARNRPDDTFFAVPKNKTEIYINSGTGAVHNARTERLIPEARYDSEDHAIYYKKTESLYGAMKTRTRGYANIYPHKPNAVARNRGESGASSQENSGGSSWSSNRQEESASEVVSQSGSSGSSGTIMTGSSVNTNINTSGGQPGGGSSQSSTKTTEDTSVHSAATSGGSSGSGGESGSIAIPFKDVPQGQYYTQPVAEAVKRGWLTTEKPHFEPAKPMTRCEFATIVIKALETPLADESEYYAGFKDLPDKGALDARHVYTGILKKYWRGQEDGSQTFGCHKELIRAEMAVVLAKVLGLKEESTYQPQDTVPAWALPAIRKAHKAGLMKGLGDGKSWGAALTLNNADAVTALFRAFGNQN